MNGYVPYDLSYLHRFFAIIKESIGNSTNIGILIFALVFAWLLVARLVKKFTR